MDNNKKVEDVFVEEKMNEAPDLWNRINSAIDEHPEQPNIVPMEVHKKKKFTWKKQYTVIAASAACFLIVVVPVLSIVAGRIFDSGYKYNSAATYDSPSYAASYPAGGAGEMALAEDAYEEPVEEMAYDADYGEAEEAPAQNADAGSDAADEMENYGKKLIRTLNITMETLNFDETLSQLTEKVNQCGGYMENSSVYQDNYGRKIRHGSFTIRVPAEKLDEFKTAAEGYGNALSISESAEDVTVKYIDTTSHIDALETERDKMMELMERAEDMDDILSIERSLTDIRYELNYYQSLKQSYDHQVTYATINFQLEEVVEETMADPISYGERMSRAFMDTLKGIGHFFQNLLIVLVAALPVLVIFAGVITGIVLIIRTAIHKNREKKKNK